VNTVKVLIVDDSAVMRSFLRDVLSSDPRLEIAGVAANAAEARLKIKETSPDVLTLDVEMPGMDGIGLLELVMRLRPTPCVMVSSLTQRGTETTLRALDAGAVDFVAKPLSDLEQSWQEFTRDVIEKVKAAATAFVPWENTGVTPQLGGAAVVKGRIATIGGSTGSVPVLQEIFKALPPDAPPVVAALHMPGGFTAQFARRLDGLCAISVVEVEDGLTLLPGHAYVAQGGSHLTIERQADAYVGRVERGPRVNGHVPSVDVLFESVARSAGAMATGLILSGMGRDGARGLKLMRDSGALTGAQDEASSLIYGMPKAAKEEGAVMEELPLAKLAAFLMRNPKVSQT
jgi:two-component system, chemotaxis family, protein-glutamate methylesterase/glutaminase